MSTPNFHRPFLFTLLALSLMLVVVLSAVSRGIQGPSNNTDKEFYGYFLRDAKTMQDMGLPVYWLGREFTAPPGGQTYRGPHGARFGGEVEGGGIYMEYTAGATDPGLEITIYSPDAWKLVKDRILDPRPVSSEGEVTRRTVTVMGQEAELLSIPAASRPVNAISLILELDPVVVVAVAGSGGQGPDGTDYNLFINNPDLLVQVMQDLRPYPE